MKSWSARSQVERVDLYTRQSLYLLLWGTSALLVVTLTPMGRDHPQAMVVVAIGAVLLSVAATRALHDVSDLYLDGPSTEVPWRSVGPLVVLAVAWVGVVLLLPSELRTGAGQQSWAALAWGLGGLRGRRSVTALLVLLIVVAFLPHAEPLAAVVGLLAGGFFVFTVQASLWLLGVVTELDRARGAQSALAVAEERLRFSRDVHDVLGRRLSTIAVQSELAATLAARGDEHSAERMLEVRAVAHEALREARELARGYRATDLTQELEGARSLLRSAGIEVDLEVDGLPTPWHEAAGWVVREGVTNVLRHSAATRVRIAYDGSALSVSNDGARVVAGGVGPAGEGSGLAGLRERLEPLGASLAVDRTGGDFAVAVTLPSAGPSPGPSPGPSLGPSLGPDGGIA